MSVDDLFLNPTSSNECTLGSGNTQKIFVWLWCELASLGWKYRKRNLLCQWNNDPRIPLAILDACLFYFLTLNITSWKFGCLTKSLDALFQEEQFDDAIYYCLVVDEYR